MSVWRRAAVAVLALAVGAGAWSAAFAAPAMWVVRDADSEIFLFGSFHALPPATPWRTAAYDAAYRAAQVVWFEAEADDPAAVRDLVARYGVDPARPLSRKLSFRQAAALRPLLIRDRLPAAAIEPLRPWAAALVLSMGPMTQRGFSADRGVDLAMARESRSEAKTVRTFETAEDQIRMFAGLPEPVEVRYLGEVIRERTSIRLWPRRSLAAAWLAGDLNRLGPGLVDEMRRESPEYYDALLRRRNLAWAQALDAQMAGSGVELVNVGALHMLGPDGLPALMAARGYAVSRVQ